MDSHLNRNRREFYSVEEIESLVRGFYARVENDESLGPIFARRVKDWDPHLARMVGFWRAVLRGEPSFRPRPEGPPPIIHQQIAELDREHFVRWLQLFQEVSNEMLSSSKAEYVQERAKRMGVALSAHLPE